MTIEEIHSILSSVLRASSVEGSVPSREDWKVLEEKFGTHFPQDFMNFMEAVTAFSFPGDILNVNLSENGNDRIAFTYDFEMKSGGWNSDMIPFYAIGNGDYFCLSAKEGRQSKVYYRYHEDNREELYSSQFSDWIKDLPDFLG